MQPRQSKGGHPARKEAARISNNPRPLEGGKRDRAAPSLQRASERLLSCQPASTSSFFSRHQGWQARLSTARTHLVVASKGPVHASLPRTTITRANRQARERCELQHTACHDEPPRRAPVALTSQRCIPGLWSSVVGAPWFSLLGAPGHATGPAGHLVAPPPPPSTASSTPSQPS